MKRLATSILLLTTALLAAPASARDLTIEGMVEAPGLYAWRDGLHLLDLTTTARVTANAWPQGAALLRTSAKRAQRKLKAGVLFDLRTARVNAERLQDASLITLVEHQQQQVRQMPVTGRVVTEMNPLKQRLLQYNLPLEPADHLVYPARPDSIRVTGAVEQDCTLPFVPAQRPAEYLQSCPEHWVANPDEIYLVQPDGSVSRVGIAPWNSDDSWLAVGGTVYVPFQPALFGDSGNDFNNEMAALLGTQYIGVEAATSNE